MISYLNFSPSTKISRRAPKNARGVLGRVQERPGVPQGVQKLSSCQCNSKIIRRDKNCRPSSYKDLGGPGRGPGTPGGSLGGPEIVKMPIPLFPLVRNADARPFLILNSNMQGSSWHSRKGRASLHSLTCIFCAIHVILDS